MGLVDRVLQIFREEKPDQSLEVFFNAAGFSKIYVEKRERTFQLSDPTIVNIPSQGSYTIFLPVNNLITRVKLHFNRKGLHIVEPVVIKKDFEEQTMFGPAKVREEYPSLRIIRLGSKQSYERAKSLAVEMEWFEYAAQFRDRIKVAKEDGPVIGEAEKPWLPKKLLLPSLGILGLMAAGIAGLAGQLYYTSKESKKIQANNFIPRKDDISALSLTEIKYHKQFGMASDLDFLVRAEIAKNPKMTKAEAGFSYLHPVHEQKEGQYNFYVNSNELKLSILIREHTGEIDITGAQERLISEFGISELYQKVRKRVWENMDYGVASEIRHDRALAKEALPWQERLSKEYGMHTKITIEYVKPSPNYSSGEVVGTKIMKLKLGNAILNYSKTAFYVKTGEEPVNKLPMYQLSPFAKPIEAFRGAVNIDNQRIAHFNETGIYAVSRGDSRQDYIENDGRLKSEEHTELLKLGTLAYNEFVGKHDISKFLRVAKEWADK
jgi:hypothetical protein